jgi:uncharacterized delta-60 repeat protein/uncharacterized repeat protein (TIGR01451 family)
MYSNNSNFCMKTNILCFLRNVTVLLLVFCHSYIHAQNASSPDITFNTGTGPTGYNVITTAIQSDGKIIIGGVFTAYNGVARNNIARLNTDGSLDAGFHVGTGANGGVITSAIQNDGKIIIGGVFSSFNGKARNCIVRLNTDGSLDTSFHTGTGANSSIIVSAIQSDGKVLIGGAFTDYNGTARNYIARLNTDGSLDSSFNIGTGADNDVWTISIQNDGKVIIGGEFTSYNGISRNRIARLNTDGSLDTGFDVGTGANNFVETVSIQSDGKIIIGGGFFSFDGINMNNLARLNPDGSLDHSFNPGTGADNTVFTSAIQSDGKILIAGLIGSYNGKVRNGIARLNPDGSLDETFNQGSGANGAIYSISIQDDDKIIISGIFGTYNGITSKRIARLQPKDPVYYNTVRGNIFTDANHDCDFQASEPVLPFMIVKAFPGPFYSSSDSNGNYEIRVDSGAAVYTLSQEFNSISSMLWANQCSPSQTVFLAGSGKDSCCFDFADAVNLECFLLTIDVQKVSARQCIRNYTNVNYSNAGNSPVSEAVVKIEYPSHFIPLTSTPMWTSIQGSVLTFDVGTIQAGQSGQIIITDSVDCREGIGGKTECIQATISPSSNCFTPNPGWDKSSMIVTGTCMNGVVHFNITNDGSGDMADSMQYRIYVNDTLIFTGNYKLTSGEAISVHYPSEGKTIRLEADQHPLHPGKSRPRFTIEDCGVSSSPIVRSRVGTVPQDELDEEVAITCALIRNSYDPNEKQAFPMGTGSAHNIEPGQEIEYVIHFQNTGNDIAYNVLIVDTLDAGLDIASFTKGTSSHPYTLSVSGKGQAVLHFKFDQINLPDSSTNQLGSNGLISFRVAVPSNANIGTVIKNKAYIFFDYNSAITTNETMHTVDTITYKNLSKGSAVWTGDTDRKFSQSAKIYPNPALGMITVEIPQLGNNSELRIISLLGILQQSVSLSSTIQEVNIEGLSQGMYLYEIWQDGERKSGGKLQIR